MNMLHQHKKVLGIYEHDSALNALLLKILDGGLLVTVLMLNVWTLCLH